jgi:hypothetical protein
MTKNTPEYASPPCFAHEVDPSYNGLLNSDQIIVALQELLEGERAGARIARESLDQVKNLDLPGALPALIEQIKSDETAYCSMLIGQVKSLGGQPSLATGAFYEKCMAYTDLHERFNFLNRGQGWVVKRINELLPQLNNQDLVAALVEMRNTHQSNIEKTSAILDCLL